MRLIAFRLIMAFCCIIFFLAVQGLFAHYNATHLAAIHRSTLMKQLELKSIQETAAHTRLTVYKLLGTMNPWKMDRLRKEFLRSAEHLERELNRLRFGEELLLANRRLYEEVIGLHYDFSVKTARDLLDTQSKDAHEELIHAIARQAGMASENSQDQIQSANNRSLFFAAVLCVTALIAACIWAFILARTLTDRSRADNALREQYAFLQTLIDTIPDPVYYKDTGGRYIGCNAAFERMTRKPRQEIVGKTVHEMGPDLMADRYYEKDIELFARPGTQRFEGQLMESGNELRTAIFNKATFNDAEGRVAGIVGIITDITDQKKANESLRLTQFSLDAARVSIFWISPEGRFLYVNDEACRKLGYTRAELLSMGVYDIDPAFPESSRPGHWQQFKHSKVIVFETTHRTKGGTIYPVEVTSTYLSYADHEYEFAFARDINDRKKAAEALSESESRFRAVVETTTDAVVIADDDMHIIYWNEGARRLFAYDGEEVIGKNPELLVADTNLYRERRAQEQLQKEGFTSSLGTMFESTGRRKDGSTFPMEISNSRWQVGDRFFYSAIIRDISGRKAMEEQLRQSQKMEAIGTLAGGIAHDFNNILEGIVGYAELAGDDSESESAKRYCTEAVVLCMRGRDLIRQILTYSRKDLQERDQVYIGPIVKESIKMLRSSLPVTIQIHTDIAEQPVAAAADPIQIQQMVINLCTNAAHALMDTGGRIDISLSSGQYSQAELASLPQLPPGRYACLRVTDNGAGIDPAIADRIFDPFFTTKAPGQGTGMGLAVVQGIVTNHDGAISVVSVPGKGTTFTVLLPEVDKGPEAVTEPHTPVTGGQEHILFIDDEESIVYSCRLILERLGYRVTATQSSAEALRIFSRAPDTFDLVITDQTMPDMTGCALAQKLVRIRKNIPIVLSSGFSDPGVHEGSMAHIQAFMQKPITKEELAETVRRVLDTAQC